MGWQAMLPKRYFDMFHKKTKFPFFWALERPVFCEVGTKAVARNGTTPLFPQSRPHSTPQNQKAQVSEISGYFLPFKRVPADSAGTGPVLNCSSITDHPLFFTKIISSFRGTHFITNPAKYTHESTPRHGWSPRRVRSGLETDARNSEKIKIMENLHRASFYVT